MKKTLLLLVISAAGFAVAAQQKNLPSLNEYFNKKEQSLSTAPGNFLLRSPGIGKSPFSKLPGVYLAPRIDVTKRMLANAGRPKFSHQLPNGNIVITLPQDNMPCVVPSMENYNMPVVNVPLDQDRQIHAIPPPATEPKTGK